jgi:monofunctional biosynthetic peptidoglycan transglycosylase
MGLLRFAKRGGWVRRLLIWLLLILVAAPVALLLLFRFVPPPGTPEMLVSLIEGKGAHYEWTDQLPPILGKSVIGSEDQNFCSHHGFDWKSIDQAMAAHERDPRKRLRGASTISQQTAKNLFLWGGHSYVRKGLEAWFTFLLELCWPKTRILEVYLNSAQFGPDVYGVEAAAQSFFHKPASTLTRSEAAQLAAVLPNPVRLHAGRPSAYVASRREWILGQMRGLGDLTYLRNLH